MDGPARNSKPGGDGGGILGALQMALQQREKAIHSSGAVRFIIYDLLVIHSAEGQTLETSAFESFTVANLPYRPCG